MRKATPAYIGYASPMQAAFVTAAVNNIKAPTAMRIAKAADHQRLMSEREVAVKVSFRTAQKLRAQGVLE
ncbi:hypothetical protein GNX71_18480 [Variovorax sp. RKNM96]|uniref:hypothetical protein n=1 Tax=Variovorax sp. RKNM96 TaxID=2681552 RepID=UPI00197F26BE|nr:hypothetical protein [Variovorax sp. RKNM96]QSI31457.1 hypothetical protein GNX71_18480 [Variovorax sp. RKNM96]